MEDGKGEGGKCDGGCCEGSSAWGMYGGHHHGAGHLIVKLIIIVFVFWAGVQFGALKAVADGRADGYQRGYGMMGNYYYGDAGGYGVGYGPGMMVGYRSAPATTTK